MWARERREERKRGKERVEMEGWGRVGNKRGTEMRERKEKDRKKRKTRPQGSNCLACLYKHI